MSEEKVDRRGYMKYAGAGVVVIAVAGAGAYYATRAPATSPTTTPTAPQTVTVTGTVTQATPKTKTVLRHFHDLAVTRPAYEPMIKQVEEYNETHPDVEVNTQFVDWANRVPIITAMVKGGVPPDGFRIMAEEVPVFSESEIIRPADEYIPDEFYDRIPQKLFDNITYKDGVYGLPTDNAECAVLFYDVEKFEKAGVVPPTVEDPWSWDEFIQEMTKLSDPAKGIYGYGARAGSVSTFIPRHWYWIFFIEGVAPVMKVNGEWRSGASYPGFKRALEKIYDLTNTHQVCPKDVVGYMSADDLRVALAVDKKVACVNVESWFKGQVSKHPEFKWKECPQPTLEGSLQEGTIQINIGVHAIQKESMHPEEMMDFYVWMSDYERVVERFVTSGEGYIPSDKKFIDDPRCDENSRLHVTLHPYTRPWTIDPYGNEVASNVMTPYVQQLLSGDIKPDDALSKMDEEITNILQD